MPPSPPAKLSSPLRLPPERPGAATTNLRPRRVGRDRSRRFALGLVGAMTLLSLLLGWFFRAGARPHRRRVWRWV
ncbi:MAG: hypothetical protein HC824_10110 [Synechococcales cyanobacterium RM1_1_8]|nr:hypothetical protein [Synechococcales cyanobacterium RM1_1_8]